MNFFSMTVEANVQLKKEITASKNTRLNTGIEFFATIVQKNRRVLMPRRNRLRAASFIFLSRAARFEAQEGLASRTFYRLANTRYALLHTRLVPPVYLASIPTLSRTTAIPLFPSQVGLEIGIDESRFRNCRQKLFSIFIPTAIKSQPNWHSELSFCICTSKIEPAKIKVPRNLSSRGHSKNRQRIFFRERLFSAAGGEAIVVKKSYF